MRAALAYPDAVSALVIPTPNSPITTPPTTASSNCIFEFMCIPWSFDASGGLSIRRAISMRFNCVSKPNIHRPPAVSRP